MRFSEMVFKSLAASIESMMVVYSVSISGSTEASQEGAYIETEGSGVNGESCPRRTRHVECVDGHFHQGPKEPLGLMAEGVDKARLDVCQNAMTAMLHGLVSMGRSNATVRCPEGAPDRALLRQQRQS